MPRKSTSSTAATSAEQPLRRKVTLACMVCRKKKVKCNGVQPACSRCQTMGLQCQYSDPPKKRGPPKGYVEVINSRARRIESLLSNSGVYRPMMTTNQNNNISNSNNNDNSLTKETTTTTATTTTSYNRQQPSNDILKFVADCVPTTFYQQMNTYSPDSHTPLYDFYPNDDGMMMNMMMNNDDEPAADLMLAWVDSFFTHFNVFFPILARQHFLHQLVHERQGIDPLLRGAVYALGCHFLNPHDRTGRLWYDKCQALMLSTNIHMSHDVPSLPTVQALVIICWHSYLLGDLRQCYTIRQHLAHATGALAMVQGHTNKNTTVEQELVRRAIWVAHVVNQWLSVCTGDHVAFGSIDGCPLPKLEDCQLHAIDCRILQPPIVDAAPTVESAFQVAVFSEMVKLASIVQRATTFQSVNKNEIAEWLFNLPPYLDCSIHTDTNRSTTEAPSPVARIFHMLYHTVLIILNQPDIDTNVEARSICSTSANTIIHLAEQMTANSPDQSIYLYNVFGLSITLAATIHLHLARSFDPRIQCPAKINLGKSMHVIRNANPTTMSHLPALLEQHVASRYAIYLGQENNSQQEDDGQRQQKQTTSAAFDAPDDVNQSHCRSFKRPADEMEEDNSLLNYHLRQGKRPCVFDFNSWLPPEQEQQHQQPHAIITPGSSTSTLDDTASLIDLFSIPGWEQQQHTSPFSIDSTSPSLSPQPDTTPSPTATCFSPDDSPPLLSMNQLHGLIKQENTDLLLLDNIYLPVTDLM